MSELLIPSLPYADHAINPDSIPSPTRAERARIFMHDYINASEKEQSCELASGWVDTKRAMGRTAVLIPVAAHQDAHLVGHTLSEYGKQQNCDPFTIFLSSNGAEGTVTQDDFDAVK